MKQVSKSRLRRRTTGHRFDYLKHVNKAMVIVRLEHLTGCYRHAYYRTL